MSGQQDDILIAVMGRTGTGKSSFVRLLSGDTSVLVGHSLESETKDVQAVTFRDPYSGRRVTLVDTPGFDDSRSSFTDTDVLKTIADFLLKTYDNQRKLNGVIYLQRISDSRFDGQSGRNLKMFRNLCGTKAYENVVILTTFWDNVNFGTGEDREQEMKTKYFKDLFAGGAQFMRHDRTIESSRNVLRHILTLVPTHVRIQEEIRLEHKSLEETAAGSAQRKEVELVIAKHNEELSELKGKLQTARDDNSALRQGLEGQRARLKQELTRWEAERMMLRRGLEGAREAQEKLAAGAAEEKENYEELRRNQERQWQSQFNDQQNQYNEALRQQQEEERQRHEEEERERKRRRRRGIMIDVGLLLCGPIGIALFIGKKVYECFVGEC